MERLIRNMGRPMRSIRNALVIVSALACNLQAQTVRSDLIFGRPGLFGGTFSFYVWQNADATDYTGVDFTYTGSSISSNGVLLDEGSDWYVVHSGDSFSRATIGSGQFAPLETYGGPRYPAVTVGTDFYLGVATGQGYHIPRTVFGWAHLQRVGGVITMVDNVMSYNSPGIIIGTTTLVPEPTAIALIVSGLIVASCKDERGKQFLKTATMKYRKLRIAWSVVGGIACVLLIVFWVRSYWRIDWLSH